MGTTVNALPPDQDPRSQAVAPGAVSSEYRLARLAVLAPMVAGGLLTALALIPYIRGTATLTDALALIGVFWVPVAPAAAWAARGYSSDRAGLKAQVAVAAAEVASSDALAPQPLRAQIGGAS